MAVEFKQEGDVLRITQTRAGWRWTAVVLGVFWVVGAVVAVVQSLHETPTSLDCDHAEGRCTLTEGRRVSERPIASLVRASVEVDDDAASVLLESREPPRFRWICGAAPDPAAVAAVRGLAAEIEAFRADPSHPPIALRCVGREVHGAKLHIVLPASLLGWLLVLLLTLRFSEELRVVLDRRAGTLDVAGRRWFRAPWHVQRPLADVAGIELRSRPAMRGQSYFSVHAVLTDGSDVRLWSPAAVRMSTLTDRVAALRAFLGPRRREAGAVASRAPGRGGVTGGAGRVARSRPRRERQEEENDPAAEQREIEGPPRATRARQGDDDDRGGRHERRWGGDQVARRRGLVRR